MSGDATRARYAALAEQAATWCRLCRLAEDTVLTWQVFSPVGATEDGGEVAGGEATFAAAPHQLAAELRRRCHGAAFPNVYLTSGLHDPPSRRRQETCCRVLTLTLDADACDWLAATRPAEYPTAAAAKAALHQLDREALAVELDQHQATLLAALLALGLEPTSLVRSGYGHYALLVLEADTGAVDVALCREVNADLVAALNATAGYALVDPAAKDAGTRVLRLPGAFNVKEPSKPRRCRFLTTDGPVWPIAALRELVPHPERPAPVTPPAPAAPAVADPGAGRLPEAEVARRALAAIPADDYGVWIGVGKALHALGFELAEWEAWSATSARFADNDPGECERRWRTFDGADKPDVAAGYLVNRAREHDPGFLAEGYRRRERVPRPAPTRPSPTAEEASPMTAELAGADVVPLRPEGNPFGQRHCEPGRHQRTDIGNSERLVALAGDRLRWCVDWQEWLVYDGTRWKRDPGGVVARALAKLVAQSIAREALAAPEHERPALLKWAATSQARSKVSDMLWLAQPDLTVVSTALDANPYLLNTPTGTVDLRTGTLRPHDPADMISRCTTAGYVPGADLADTLGAAAWRQFITDTTSGDDELASYLQRAAGYSVTGDPCEEVFFFAYGVERTGKSTFLATIAHHLADYADQADFTAFLKKRDDSELRPELAKLQGKRFVASSETSAGRALAEGLVKTITGNEPISTAAKYRDPVTWLPAFTLWLAANDRPTVRHDDGALWRRIKVVPFLNQVPADTVDSGLKERLRDTGGEAVIAWLVRGCLAWQAHGLGSCPAVGEATAEYREEMDPLGGWLAERCDMRPEQDDWFTPTAELYRSFRRWAQTTNDHADLSQKQFGELLTKRGLNRTQRRVGTKRPPGYLGIRLTEQPEFGFEEEAEDPQSDEFAPKRQGCRSANEACVKGVNPVVDNFPDPFSQEGLSDNTLDTLDTLDACASDSPEIDPEQDW